jgi:prepilin-type N-terminal cleavage/methylation domain-containing protein
MLNNHTPRHSQAFTLIELLIVMAIIGILAAIVIPQYQNSIRKANEAAAVTTINTIKVAEAKHILDHERYGTFNQLFQEGYLDKRFNKETPCIRGYIFVLTLIDAPAKPAITFQLNANPEVSSGIGATGKAFYYSEPDAGIFINRESPANANDPIL